MRMWIRILGLSSSFNLDLDLFSVKVRVCVCACMRVCVYACMRVCVCACMRVFKNGTRWVVNYEIWNTIVSMWYCACAGSLVICIGIDFMIRHFHANSANMCTVALLVMNSILL